MSNSDEFEGFVYRVLRDRGKGSFEYLLAQHLAAAVVSEPIQKIRLICEAYYMVPDVNLFDNELVHVIYSVSLSFLHVMEEPVLKGFKISWGFELNEENFNRYINPWFRRVNLFYISRGDDDLKSGDFWERFFETTYKRAIPIHTINVLRVLFIQWAMPHVMKLFEKLTRLIDPELYREIIVGLKRGEGESEGLLD